MIFAFTERAVGATFKCDKICERAMRCEVPDPFRFLFIPSTQKEGCSCDQSLHELSLPRGLADVSHQTKALLSVSAEELDALRWALGIEVSFGDDLVYAAAGSPAVVPV